eukprot:1687797-Rhodomonas_salina.2
MSDIRCSEKVWCLQLPDERSLWQEWHCSSTLCKMQGRGSETEQRQDIPNELWHKQLSVTAGQRVETRRGESGSVHFDSLNN